VNLDEMRRRALQRASDGVRRLLPRDQALGDEVYAEGASRAEIIEAIEIGVMAGGSITYPNARFAFAVLEKSGERPSP